MADADRLAVPVHRRHQPEQELVYRFLRGPGTPDIVWRDAYGEANIPEKTRADQTGRAPNWKLPRGKDVKTQDQKEVLARRKPKWL